VLAITGGLLNGIEPDAVVAAVVPVALGSSIIGGVARVAELFGGNPSGILNAFSKPA
jgi:hypothetical protein